MPRLIISHKKIFSVGKTQSTIHTFQMRKLAQKGDMTCQPARNSIQFCTRRDTLFPWTSAVISCHRADALLHLESSVFLFLCVSLSFSPNSFCLERDLNVLAIEMQKVWNKILLRDASSTSFSETIYTSEKWHWDGRSRKFDWKWYFQEHLLNTFSAPPLRIVTIRKESSFHIFLPYPLPNF